MKLGSDLSRLIGELLVGPGGIDELPEIAFAHGIFDILRTARQRRQVETIAVEQDERGIALAGFVSLHAAVLQHEEYSALVLHDVALLGDDGGALLCVALVIDEDPQQLPVRPSFPDMQGEPVLYLGETPGLHDIADQVGADLGGPAAQLAKSPRRDEHADRRNQKGDDDRGRQERAEQDPRRHAGRVHHDDLGIIAELVEHMRNRDHQREWGDDLQKQRHDQTGDADEDEDALTLICHQVDVAQGLRDPHQRSNAGANHQKRTQGGAKNIAADRPHPTYASPLASNHRCARPPPAVALRYCSDPFIAAI